MTRFTFNYGSVAPVGMLDIFCRYKSWGGFALLEYSLRFSGHNETCLDREAWMMIEPCCGFSLLAWERIMIEAEFFRPAALVDLIG